jgi:hypothetical protein
VRCQLVESAERTHGQAWRTQASSPTVAPAALLTSSYQQGSEARFASARQLEARSHAEEEEEMQLELSALTRSVWYLVCSQLAFRLLVRIMSGKKGGSL